MFAQFFYHIKNNRHQRNIFQYLIVSRFNSYQMKTKVNFSIIIFIFSIVFLSSCQYDFIVEPVVPPPNPTDTISFVNQIEPIFNTNDNCVSCHKTGNQAPDLTTGNAFNSIMSMALINTANPESSSIYWVPNPDNASDHTWKKYTATEAQLVLQWIKQGAQNN